MKTKTTVGLLAIGVVSLLAIGNPDAANANARNRQKILDRKTRARRTPRSASCTKIGPNCTVITASWSAIAPI